MRIYHCFCFLEVDPLFRLARNLLLEYFEESGVGSEEKNENKDDRDRRGMLGFHVPMNVLTHSFIFRYPPPQPFSLPQVILSLLSTRAV